MTTSGQVMQRLNTLIRARHSLIVVNTREEERIDRLILQIGNQLGKKVYFWDAVHGMRVIQNGQPQTAEAQTIAPLAFLKSLFDRQGDNSRAESAIYIAHDLHPFFRDPQVVRAMRMCAQSFRPQEKTLVVIGSNITIPSDCESEATIVDLPLPGADNLKETIATTLLSVRSRIPVDLDNEGVDALVDELLGLDTTEALQALSEATVTEGRVSLSAIPYVRHRKMEKLKRNPVLQIIEPSVDYSDIGEYDILLNHLRMLEQCRTPEAWEFGAGGANHLLMVGYPGTGKSTCAQIAAHGLPLIRMDVAAAYTKELGGTERHMKEAEDLVQAYAGNDARQVRVVLWLDEIQRLMAESEGETNGNTSNRVIAQWLTWMSGLPNSVMIVATANRLSGLSPEFLRRWTDVFWLPLPSAQGRADIAAIHLTKRNRNPEYFDLRQIAQATPMFSGAEIEKAVQKGIRLAFVQRASDVTTEHIIEASRTISPAAKSRNMVKDMELFQEYAGQFTNASSHANSPEFAARPPRDDRGMMYN